MTTLNATLPAIIREGEPDWAFPDPPKRFDAHAAYCALMMR